MDKSCVISTPLQTICGLMPLTSSSLAMRIGSVLLLSTLLLLQGCSTLGYYAQSIHGHLSLMSKSEAIDRLLKDPATDEKLKARLRLVQAIRDFASEALRLPENGSYRRYAALEGEAVVWSLVATPEFSMQPRQWCYLVVGCASYRGYFAKSAAEEHAERLRRQGLDVTVEPVPAYSTLGWFDDPLPSTVIDWPESHLAGLIFHEMAHQQLYVQDDSAFNEAFANAVEQIGVVRWFERRGDADALAQWYKRRRYGQTFVNLLLETRGRLEQLYSWSLDEREMRRRKRQEFVRLEQRYAALVAEWGGYHGLDHWFDRELNNARLASVATYEQWLPAFIQLYRQGRGMGQFLSASERLSKLPKAERDARLHALLRQASTGAAQSLSHSR